MKPRAAEAPMSKSPNWLRRRLRSARSCDPDVRPRPQIEPGGMNAPPRAARKRAFIMSTAPVGGRPIEAFVDAISRVPIALLNAWTPPECALRACRPKARVSIPREVKYRTRAQDARAGPAAGLMLRRAAKAPGAEPPSGVEANRKFCAGSRNGMSRSWLCQGCLWIASPEPLGSLGGRRRRCSWARATKNLYVMCLSLEGLALREEGIWSGESNANPPFGPGGRGAGQGRSEAPTGQNLAPKRLKRLRRGQKCSGSLAPTCPEAERENRLQSPAPLSKRNACPPLNPSPSSTPGSSTRSARPRRGAGSSQSTGSSPASAPRSRAIPAPRRGPHRRLRRRRRRARPHRHALPSSASRGPSIARRSRAPAPRPPRGGVTSLVMRPDTNPCVDDPAVVDFILRRARDDAKVRIFPSAALTKGLAGHEIAEIGLLAEAGAVAFSDGPHSVAEALTMRRAMTYARDFDALVAPVCEDRSLSGEGVMAEGLRASWLGLPGIPREAETIALERDLRLVGLTGARYHAALLSNRLSLDGDGAGAGRGPERELRRLDQQSHAQRTRRRRLSDLPQAHAAVARRGGAHGAGRGAERRAHRRRSAPTTIRRTSRPSGCPSLKPRPARSASRRCCRRACAWSREAMSACRGSSAR